MQTIDLTTPYAVPNGTKLEISRPDFDDDAGTCSFSVTLRSNNITSMRISGTSMVIRDGQSDQLERQASPSVGLLVDDPTRWFVMSKRTTATGYTDLVNAWRANGTANNRQAAFKALLLSAGHIGSTLTGT